LSKISTCGLFTDLCFEQSCRVALVLGDPARLGRLAHMTPPAHTCPNVCLQNITKPNDCSVWVGDTAIALSQPKYSKCFLKMPKPRYIYIKMLKTENFSFIVIGLTEIGYLDNAIGFSTIKYPPGDPNFGYWPLKIISSSPSSYSVCVNCYLQNSFVIFFCFLQF